MTRGARASTRAWAIELVFWRVQIAAAEQPRGAFAAAGLQDPEHRDGDGIVAGVLPFPTRGNSRCPYLVSA